MEFQKAKIIEKLENNGWSYSDSYTPEDIWPYLEIITFKKGSKFIYLTFFKDPTEGYLFKKLKKNTLKTKSKHFDALLYGSDPNLNENPVEISELNLGKGWEIKLSDFISASEEFYKKTNYNSGYK